MKMTNREKTLEDVHTFVTMVAKKQNWKINRDKELLNVIMEGLKTNYNRFGYFSCPCRDSDGIKKEDKDIVCPCDYSVPDQKEFGHCYCGLFLTPEFYEKNIDTTAIPERRE